MVRTGVKVRAGSALHSEVVEWMDTEAELLDEYREREWLEEMVSREVVYQVPLRQTVERARGTGFAADTYHLDETYGSLASRVARNETAYAWAEDPPSRIRHFGKRSPTSGARTAAATNSLFPLPARLVRL